MASDDRLTPEQIAEWRARALVKVQGKDCLDLIRRDLRIIAQADAENHLGYFDTRTHVAVPKEPTEVMGWAALRIWQAGPTNDSLSANPSKWFAPVYRAMLAASENEDG